MKRLHSPCFQAQRGLFKLRLRMGGEVGALGQLLSPQRIGVFVGAALPR
jgi:hypothetical protein